MQNKKAKSQNKTRRNTLTILYKIWEAYYYYNIDALLGRTDKANYIVPFFTGEICKKKIMPVSNI